MTALWTDTHPTFIPNLAARRLDKTYKALGTRIVLTAFGTATEADLDDAFTLIMRYEDLLTVNRANSEVMAVNHAAGHHPVQVSTTVYKLTKLAVAMSKQQFGFNAAIGPLVKLWKIGFADAAVPKPEAIQANLSLINPVNIRLNDSDLSIFLTQAGMELDLGAIAKGYIADRIADLWASRGINAGIINLGGNLLMVGDSPLRSDKLWRIGIQDPFSKRGQSIGLVKMGPCSAVTSGIYERHLEVAGKSYHHILDPQTGYPYQTDLAGVTVFTTSSVQAEIETTRLFFAGKNIDLASLNSPELLGAVFVTIDRGVKVVGLPTDSFQLLDQSYHLI